VGAYRPFGLGHEDMKEMAGIHVTAKEIERMSHALGQQVGEFFRDEADMVLSEKVIPIQTVPLMYVSMDGTGVPWSKQKQRTDKARVKMGRRRPGRRIGMHFYTNHGG